MSPSMEWASWLLSFLIADVLPQLAAGAVHNGLVFNTLVDYLQTPAVPFKHRVIQTLSQLVARPDKFSSRDVIDLSRLSGIR